MRNDNLNDRNEELRDGSNEQLRPNTTNENIRDNNTRQQQEQDTSHGVNSSPNDASGVLSGGTVDMDNQGDVGAHAAPGSKGKFGSNLEPKHNVTGSDFDGQVSTS